MICTTCGNETDTVFEVRGYAGSYAECPDCFGEPYNDEEVGMTGISMEKFGPVALDYFNGRRVEEIYDGPDGEGEPVWTIRLEGDALIHNYDPRVAKPMAILGAGLSMVILGGHQGEPPRPVTELRFGLETVYLNPLEYAMVDPIFTKGQVVYAQRSEANMPVEAGRTPQVNEDDDDGA